MTPAEETALRDRIRDLELALGQRDGTDRAIALHLPPVLNNLMGLLLAVKVVSPDMIQDRLGITPESRAAIFRLRKHLVRWDIHVRSARHLGYWLDDADKEKLRAIIATNSNAAPDLDAS